MKAISFFFISALCLVLISTGCQDPVLDDFVNMPPLKEFDIDLFQANIIEELDGKCMGFAYTISQHGNLKRSGAEGLAQTSKDGGAVDMSIHHRIYMASVSKTITATAAMQLIAKLGLSIDDPVSPFLPAHWIQGPGVNNLTFKDLLTHKSGLKGDGASYYNLKSYIALGINPADKTYDYQNSNFSLFRILIPIMSGMVSKNMGLDNLMDGMTATAYIRYINQEVFAPAKVYNADCKPSGKMALLYRWPWDQSTGTTPGDRTLLSGGGGWYISAFELGSFLAYLEFSEDILSTEDRKIMKDNFLGYEEGASTSNSNDYGTYLMKNGGFRLGNAPFKGVKTLIVDYPNGVQLALVINSHNNLPGDDPGNHAHVYTLARDAFDNAWE